MYCKLFVSVVLKVGKSSIIKAYHKEFKYPQKPVKPSKPSYPQNPQTSFIVSKETASRLLLRNTHLHTFNSDCRTFNDYQTSINNISKSHIPVSFYHEEGSLAIVILCTEGTLPVNRIKGRYPYSTSMYILVHIQSACSGCRGWRDEETHKHTRLRQQKT